MAYFGKELSDQPIYVGGHPLRFSCLKTEDQWLITELRNAIKQGVGGVYELSDEAAYQECVKKKHEEISRLSSANSRSSEILPLHLSNHQLPRPVGRAAVAGGKHAASGQGADLPDPLSVPDPKVFVVPTIGKLPV